KWECPAWSRPPRHAAESERRLRLVVPMDREEARHYRVLGDVVPHLRRAVAADGGGAQEVRRPRRISGGRCRREREPEHGSASSREAADAVHVPLGRERRSGARLSSPEHVLRRCSRHQRARRVYGGRGGSGYRGGVTAGGSLDDGPAPRQKTAVAARARHLREPSQCAVVSAGTTFAIAAANSVYAVGSISRNGVAR